MRLTSFLQHPLCIITIPVWLLPGFTLLKHTSDASALPKDPLQPPSPACRGFQGPTPTPLPLFQPTCCLPTHSTLASQLFPELSRHIDSLPALAVRHPACQEHPLPSQPSRLSSEVISGVKAELAPPDPAVQSPLAPTPASAALATLLVSPQSQAAPPLGGSLAGERGQSQARSRLRHPGRARASVSQVAISLPPI